MMILCAWTVGAIVSLAPIFGWKDPDFSKRVMIEHKCLVSQDVAYQIFATISTFYAPLVLLLALYWRIFQVSRRFHFPRLISAVQARVASCSLHTELLFADLKSARPSLLFRSSKAKPSKQTETDRTIQFGRPWDSREPQFRAASQVKPDQARDPFVGECQVAVCDVCLSFGIRNSAVGSTLRLRHFSLDWRAGWRSGSI